MRIPKRRSLLGYAPDQVRRAVHRMEAEYEQKKKVMETELVDLLDQIAELERKIELSGHPEQGGAEG
jgi:hypothetical protein